MLLSIILYLEHTYIKVYALVSIVSVHFTALVSRFSYYCTPRVYAQSYIYLATFIL